VSRHVSAGGTGERGQAPVSAAWIEEADARRMERCLAGGGVTVFPTDTVYGVCCDAEDEQAARRLYALKGRPAARPAAVMFFALEPVFEMLSDLHDAERAALRALLPGAVTLLLPNRSTRFAPACRTDPATLGLRVPLLPAGLSALCSLPRPVMQTSANLSGEPDARTLAEVPKSMLDGVDVALDGGELAGTPSTVIDLRDYAEGARWHVLREGALSSEAVGEVLAAV
jgi:L-threonylcarbamoyladenylate synthase